MGSERGDPPRRAPNKKGNMDLMAFRTEKEALAWFKQVIRAQGFGRRYQPWCPRVTAWVGTRSIILDADNYGRVGIVRPRG